MKLHPARWIAPRFRHDHKRHARRRRAAAALAAALLLPPLLLLPLRAALAHDASDDALPAALTHVAARLVQASDRIAAEAGNQVYALSHFALRWDSLCAAALLALICIARCTGSWDDAKSYGGGAACPRPSHSVLSEPVETARLLVDSV